MDNLQLLRYEVILHWIAVSIYVISTIFFAYSVSFKKTSPLNTGVMAAMIGLIPHAIAIAIRWNVSGHGPYMSKYEVLTSHSWVAIVMFLLIVWKIPKLRAAGVVILPLSFLMMTIGLFTNPDISLLGPTLSGVWLVIHVIFNKLSAGGIIIALASSVLYLLKNKNEQKEFYQKLPSLEVLDAYSYKFIGFAFIFWTITVVAGSIWANQAWGRYWGWDPIETWSIITWLLFGLYLHLRHFFKWKGIKAAWLLIACFLSAIMSLYFIPFIIDTLHSSYFV